MNTDATPMPVITKEEAIDFFSEFYFGAHHIPGDSPKTVGNHGWAVMHNLGELATFDYNGLTRLVLMAHDKCIRVSISPVRNGIMKIMIHRRSREDKSIFGGHPTIEQAIEFYNSKKAKP